VRCVVRALTVFGLGVVFGAGAATATTFLGVPEVNPIFRVVNGLGWSWDVAGTGIRIDSRGDRRLSLQAMDASTIRYDGQQIEVVFGDGSANFALVSRHHGPYAPSFEIRNTFDTDGIWMQYGLDDEPTLSVVGSQPNPRSLYVKPKNADSVALTVDGGVRLRDIGILLPCADATRGMFTFMTQPTGDVVAVCAMSVLGELAWRILE